MKNIVVIALTFICLNASAQKHLIGLKSGLNFSNIYDANAGAQTEYQTGLTAGLTYEILFKKHFSLGLDFIYNERGFNKTNTYPITILPSTMPYRKISESYNNNYLSIPIKVGYTYGEKILGFVNIGICAYYLLNAKYSAILYYKDGMNPPDSETRNITDAITKIDLAIWSEVGFGYKLKNKYYFYTSIANQAGLFPIFNQKGSPPSYNGIDSFSEKTKNFGYTFSFGMKFNLGKQKNNQIPTKAK